MLIQELKNLGLSEKEAKVYLASLELGPASVQEIAQKAGIVRTTTYNMIESLRQKGLMSRFTRGKRPYFTPEAPDRLLSLLELQKKEIEEKEKRFKQFLSDLRTIYKLAGERPKVRFFEGKEGLKAIQEDILKTKTKTIDEFIALDEAYKVFPPGPKDHRQKIAQKIKKERIRNRIIYTSQKGPILPKKDAIAERRFLPPEKFPFSAEIVIYAQKINLVSYIGKLVGVIVEEKSLAEAMRKLFDLAWQGAKKYQK